jgi:hypothetical protein
MTHMKVAIVTISPGEDYVAQMPNTAQEERQVLALGMQLGYRYLWGILSMRERVHQLRAEVCADDHAVFSAKLKV